MAKYLLLTMVLNVFAILVTVVVINVYFRGPTTHTMPDWLRKTFLDFMPKARRNAHKILLFTLIFPPRQ